MSSVAPAVDVALPAASGARAVGRRGMYSGGGLVAQVLVLARADIRERTRRGSFLAFLLATIGFGWLGFAGHIEMRIGDARGVLDSAWVGTLMALGTSFFLTMVGFYVVKGTIAFDRKSGVGELLAASPLPAGAYLASKWLANAALFASAIGVLAAASVLLQWHQGEAGIELVALLWPMLLLTIPAALAVGAFAVFFETVPWLRGGFGNVVWFFLWSLGFAVAMATNGAFDWVGMGVVKHDLERDFVVATGEAGARLSYTIGGGTVGGAESAFGWNGLEADLATVGPRLGVVVFAGLLATVGALWFDRFARGSRPAPNRRRRPKVEAPTWASPKSTQADATTLVSLPSFTLSWRPAALVGAELRLALGSLPRALTLLVLVPGLVAGSAAIETGVGFAVAAALAPILIWSKLGMRERFHGVDQVLWSAPRPIVRQLLASWGAGVAVAGLALGPWIVRLLASGEIHRASVATAGLLVIPALALACGVWSGSSRLFEGLYVALWYAGPANRIPALDWVGVTSEASPLGPLVATLLCLSLAAIGRHRQIAAR